MGDDVDDDGVDDDDGDNDDGDDNNDVDDDDGNHNSKVFATLVVLVMTKELCVFLLDKNQ